MATLDQSTLSKISGLTFIIEGTKKEEIAFSCPVYSIEDNDIVEVTVRCPKIRDLILFNKAHVYRSDGGSLPPGWGPLDVEDTLGVLLQFSDQILEGYKAVESAGIGISPFRGQIRNLIERYLEGNPGSALHHLPALIEGITTEYILKITNTP